MKISPEVTNNNIAVLKVHKSFMFCFVFSTTTLRIRGSYFKDEQTEAQCVYTASWNAGDRVHAFRHFPTLTFRLISVLPNLS